MYQNKFKKMKMKMFLTKKPANFYSSHNILIFITRGSRVVDKKKYTHSFYAIGKTTEVEVEKLHMEW